MLEGALPCQQLSNLSSVFTMAEMNIETSDLKRTNDGDAVILPLPGQRQITVPLSTLQVKSREIGEVCY